MDRPSEFMKSYMEEPIHDSQYDDIEEMLEYGMEDYEIAAELGMADYARLTNKQELENNRL